MKPSTGNHNEKGQALILAVLALGIFFIGALGLAVDGGIMFVHRQMAQAAADAAAQAGIVSMFTGSHATAANPFSTATAGFPCTTTDLRTPCVYAQRNGFGTTAADTVTVDFPATSVAPGVTFAAGPDTLIRVTVQRNINTTLMRLLGTSTSTVRAVAIAGIVDVFAPVPILVTHPTMANAFTTNGGPDVRICGGPRRSIQVNSDNDLAQTLSNNTTIDLSRAGPEDSLVSPCATGTGADLGVYGGKAAVTFTFLPGTKPGKYVQPALPILDPLAGVPAPGAAGGQPIPTVAAPGKYEVLLGTNGCTVAKCNVYSPGLYTAQLEVKNETALFKPGLYYIQNGGFTNVSNGIMKMATGFAADSYTGSGMVVYNADTGIFDVGSNSQADLVGSEAGTIYKSILFFQSRTAPANTGNSNAHKFGGGSSITLKGTVYISNSRSVMIATPGQYQEVRIGGNSGSTTTIIGQVIVSQLVLSGAGAIRMQLDPTATLTIRQVALVK